MTDSCACSPATDTNKALQLRRKGLDLFPAVVATWHSGEPADGHVDVHHHGVDDEPLRPARALQIWGARPVFTDPLLQVDNGHGRSVRPERGSTASGGRSSAMSIRRSRHSPKGPAGSWKTGQRAPITGYWADQYGMVIHIERDHTFPPCIGRKGECAFRRLIKVARTA